MSVEPHATTLATVAGARQFWEGAPHAKTSTLESSWRPGLHLLQCSGLPPASDGGTGNKAAARHHTCALVSTGAAVLAGRLARKRSRFCHQRIRAGWLGSWPPWTSDAGGGSTSSTGDSGSAGVNSEAVQWWREHPAAGDVLLGWYQHPDLTQNTRADLEVEFTDVDSGTWISRAIGFQGTFEASMVPPLGLVLTDKQSAFFGEVGCRGCVSGRMEQKGKAGGTFELQALPACYKPWWSKVRKTLESESHDNSEGSSLVVVTGDDERKDKRQSLLDVFMGRILGQEAVGATRLKARKSKQKSALTRIQKFSLRPTEVKAHLDRYVIKQTTAKEVLSVAICDHYNRAREELFAESADGAPRAVQAPKVGKAVTGQNEVEKEVRVALRVEEQHEQRVQQEEKEEQIGHGEKKERENTNEPRAEADVSPVEFVDTDGDVIELRAEVGGVNEYVNGKLEIESMKSFDIDEERRQYTDDGGSGSFRDSEDVASLAERCAALFRGRTSAESTQEKKHRNYTKPNILLLGPTGSGKTYLLKNLAELVGVPFIKADATKFTETGYVGRDADSLMQDLLNAAGGDVELAQVGIVYVDEVDKMASDGLGTVSSFRRGTQSTFLKLLEDTEVTISRGTSPMMMDTGVKMSTRHVLFVFSGAFSELDKSLRQKHRDEAKGFGFAPDASSPDEANAELQTFLHKAGTEELVKAGLEPEFVGRIPVRVALSALSEEDLFAILSDVEDGAAAQLVEDFRRYGIQLRFHEDALRCVARLAAKQGTGARALVTVLEGALRSFKFRLPALVPKGCTALEVTEKTIEAPEKELQTMLARFPA